MIYDNPNNREDSSTDIAEVNSAGVHTSSTSYVILYDGETFYTVPAVYYDTVRHQVKEFIPAMIPGEKYTTEMMCGDAFWKLLSAGERKMAGRCVANMVVNRLLPLRFVQSKHEYPKHYELIQH